MRKRIGLARRHVPKKKPERQDRKKPTQAQLPLFTPIEPPPELMSLTDRELISRLNALPLSLSKHTQNQQLEYLVIDAELRRRMPNWRDPFAIEQAIA